MQTEIELQAEIELHTEMQTEIELQKLQRTEHNCSVEEVMLGVGLQ